jgi:hypothetical protein
VPTLTDEQVRHLAHDIVAQALTRMSDPDEDRHNALKAAVKLWLPGADEFELRVLAEKVAKCINGFAVLIDQRKERLVESGRAAPYV